MAATTRVVVAMIKVCRIYVCSFFTSKLSGSRVKFRTRRDGAKLSKQVILYINIPMVLTRIHPYMSIRESLIA